MASSNTVLAAIIAGSSALLGSLLGYVTSMLGRKLEHSKLIAPWLTRTDLEKARIESYRDLWICLGGISTYYNSDKIVQNLVAVQQQLQEWYYGRGGGLFIEGTAEKASSSKAAFFAARDLRTTDPVKIWETFHKLRANIRRDIGVFESDEDQAKQLRHVKDKFGIK